VLLSPRVIPAGQGPESLRMAFYALGSLRMGNTSQTFARAFDFICLCMLHMSSSKPFTPDPESALLAPFMPSYECNLLAKACPVDRAQTSFSSFRLEQFHWNYTCEGGGSSRGGGPPTKEASYEGKTSF
jgi:hypothetical protein